MRSALLASTALFMSAGIGLQPAHAQDATWAGATTDWNDSANWSPNTVPTGTATFAAGGLASVDNDSGSVAIGTIQFTGTNTPNPGDVNAQAYTISAFNTFLLTGSGIVNSSTNNQTFDVATSGTGNTGILIFQNASTVSGGTGGVTINNNAGSFVYFQNTSSAGNATVVNKSIMELNDSSSTGSATITNNVQIDFFDATSAGTANITNAATGTITFNNTSTANAAAIGNSGTVQFGNQSSAGSANITNNAGAVLTFNDTATAASAAIHSTGNGTITFNNSASRPTRR
jgi:hypothetical protein